MRRKGGGKNPETEREIPEPIRKEGRNLYSGPPFHVRSFSSEDSDSDQQGDHPEKRPLPQPPIMPDFRPFGRQRQKPSRRPAAVSQQKEEPSANRNPAASNRSTPIICMPQRPISQAS